MGSNIELGEGVFFPGKGVVLEIVLLRRKVDMMGKTSQVVLSGIVGSSPYFIPSPCFIPCALSTVRCPQSTLLYRPVLHRPTLACGCTPLKSEERERLISPPPPISFAFNLGTGSLSFLHVFHPWQSHFFKEANITSCKTSYNVLTKPIILADWVHLCLGGGGKGLVDIKGGWGRDNL